MVLAFWWWPHAFSAVVAPWYWRFGGGPTLLVRRWPRSIGVSVVAPGF